MSLNHCQALHVNTYNSYMYELFTFQLASFRAQNQLIHHSRHTTHAITNLDWITVAIGLLSQGRSEKSTDIKLLIS